jgi:uncharacterized protein (TIGR02145 family)
MEKLFLSILLLFVIYNLTAQDITISFQPKIAGTQIDSTWVTDQTTNQKVKLLGGEPLLLTKTTGNNYFQSFAGIGYLYPNPCNGEASLSFSTLINQEVKLSLYNISGQLISMKRQWLAPGQHLFKINFPVYGLYTLSVLKDEEFLSFKAISSGGKMQLCSIDYKESESTKQFKNGSVGKTLKYILGDILLYSVFSGKNNTIITDSPTATKTYTAEFYECIDPDKQNYPIVKIGNQWWMAGNLAYLPAVNPPSAYSSIAGNYYVYGYNGTDINAAKNTSGYSTYGVYYNWYAAMNGAASSSANPSGVQGACPPGWHLPSNEEWTMLESYLIANGYNYDSSKSGNKIAVSMAAKTDWKACSTIGTPGKNPASNNISGFSGLPSGVCSGDFYAIEQFGFWWSSSEYSSTQAWFSSLLYDLPNFARSSGDYGRKEFGFSIRCIRN